MKSIIMAFMLALGLLTGFAADDAKKTTYTVGMTGVTWAGCKKSVRAAFGKLEGVTKIDIKAGDKPGTQKVLVVSTSDKLTKDQAVKSLGDKAKTFVVKTWKKEGA